jgi:hypothetical protein
MRVSNLTEGHRVTEAYIRLSADSDCNEQRAAATDQICIRMFAFLLLEDSEWNGDIFSELSSVTQAISVP